MEILDFLKYGIKKDTPLLSIIDTFSRMCRMEIDGKDEMFLFESGPVERNGKTMLMFSLVRQFSDGDNEPTQIHADIIYSTDKSINKLSSCSWHESYGDFIQTVLLSKAFEVCKNNLIEDLDIWTSRT